MWEKIKDHFEEHGGTWLVVALILLVGVPIIFMFWSFVICVLINGCDAVS